jgi:hypothetical protein
MANVKITDLTAYTDPLNTDVLPIVDVTNNVTKKVSIANMAKNVSLGTAALPGVAFDGDPNTGIYSPGADQIGISTGGTSRIVFDASGNVNIDSNTFYVDAANNRVGLGTSSPLGTIHVKHATDANIFFRNGTAAGLSTGTIAECFNDATNATTPFYLRATSFQFGTDSGGTFVPRITATSAGLVGIGTTGPGGIFHTLTTGLDNVNFFERASGAKFGIYNSATTSYIGTFSNHDLRFATNDSEKVRIDTSGRLLVGGSPDSGGALLQVFGDRIRIGTAKTPASATATGTTGEIAWDANYIYVCTATNTWKRTAISTW